MLSRVCSKLREGKGPVWGPLKRLARGVLAFHIPVAGPTRAVFRVGYRLHVLARDGGKWIAGTHEGVRHCVMRGSCNMKVTLRKCARMGQSAGP